MFIQDSSPWTWSCSWNRTPNQSAVWHNWICTSSLLSSGNWPRWTTGIHERSSYRSMLECIIRKRVCFTYNSSFKHNYFCTRSLKYSPIDWSLTKCSGQPFDELSTCLFILLQPCFISVLDCIYFNIIFFFFFKKKSKAKFNNTLSLLHCTEIWESHINHMESWPLGSN